MPSLIGPECCLEEIKECWFGALKGILRAQSVLILEVLHIFLFSEGFFRMICKFQLILQCVTDGFG